MKISVVTVCRNSAATLRDAIDSVARQRRSGFEVEHIVVDGGSTDETRALLEASGVRWISEADRGTYDAMNKGIRLATGDVVGMLNADDVFADDGVLESVAAAFADRSLDAVYGDVRFVSRDISSVDALRSGRVRRYCSSRFWRKWMFRFGAMVPHPTFYCRKELYERLGFYDFEKYPKSADFDLELRFIQLAGAVTARIPRCLVVMRSGGQSTAFDNQRFNREDLASLKQHGIKSTMTMINMKYLFKIWGFVLPRIPFARFALIALTVFSAAFSSGAEEMLRARMAPGTSAAFDRRMNEIARLDKAAEYAWDDIKNADEARSRQKALREAFVSAIGGFPQRTPLNPVVTGVIKRDGYKIEKLHFESRPGHHVTANLFLPDSPAFSAPYPAVLVSCGHAGNGKACKNYQRACVQGAKDGFAMLIYDPIDQGERIQLPGSGIACVGGHVNLGLRAHLMGWGMAQFRIWDGMRAVDYLETRKDIDSSKIGVMGQSGGGTLTAYLAALDERLKASCPSCFVCSMRTLAEDWGPQDCEQIVNGQLPAGLNHLSLALMAWPRPVRLTFAEEDAFPFRGALSTFASMKMFYNRLGNGEMADYQSAPGPHSWYESTRQGSIEWMKRWLRGDENIAPKEQIARLDKGFSFDKVDCAYGDDPGANVLPGGSVTDLPGERTGYDFLRDELNRIDRAGRSALTRELVLKVTGIRTDAPLLPDEPSEYVRGTYWAKYHSPAKELAAMDVWLGTSSVARKAEQMIAKARASGGKVKLCAKGDDCVAAAHAYFLEPELFEGLELSDKPPAWRAYLQDDRLAGLSYDTVVYGALKFYDWVDLVRASEKRPDGAFGELVPMPRSCVPLAGAGTLDAAGLKISETRGAIEGAGADVADQAYRLEIAPAGVRITAGGDAGARYARTTFAQLVKLGGGRVPCGTVTDWPEFRWRGYMLDCGRNWQPLESIRELIDFMASYKLNLFHWHLTDYWGWRLESKAVAELSSDKATIRNPGCRYSQEEFVSLVDYAAERGVTVMPEFDVPGHTKAFRQAIGVERMADPKADAAIKAFLSEFIELVPPSKMPFIHLGTDEVRNDPEKVDPEVVRGWSRCAAAKGHAVVGWTPGIDLSDRNVRYVEMQWGQDLLSKGYECFDMTFRYIDIVDPFELLGMAAYSKPCPWNIDSRRKLGPIIGGWHDDCLGGSDDYFRNNAVLPAIVLNSDAFWCGRDTNRPDLRMRLPNPSDPAFAIAADLERRVVAQRDKVIDAGGRWPFAFLAQTQMRWRLSYEDGTLIATDVPQALIRLTKRGRSDGYCPKTNSVTVVAETWIHSPSNQTVGAWIGFTGFSRSSGRAIDFPTPSHGEWNRHGAKVELNGRSLPPPEWRNPGLKVTDEEKKRNRHFWGVSRLSNEIPLSNEEYVAREPNRITLRKGWNHVKLTMPAPEPEPWAHNHAWLGVFIPLLGTSDRPREVPGLKFSSSEQGVELHEARFSRLVPYDLGITAARPDSQVRIDRDSLAEFLAEVPCREYCRAYVTCAADPDPKKDRAFTVRLTRHVTGPRKKWLGRSYSSMADTLVELDSAVKTQVGETVLGGKKVPLYRVEVPLKTADIHDIVFTDNRGDHLDRGRYLDLELMGRCHANCTPSADDRINVDPRFVSAVTVYKVELEDTPCEIEFKPIEPGNVFHNDEKPQTRVELRVKRPGAYRLEWTVSDIDGRVVAESSCAVPASETKVIGLANEGVGWYSLKWRLKDADRLLLTHDASFAILGRDTRQSKRGEGYGIWPPFSGHYRPDVKNPAEREIGLKLVNKAGFRRLFDSARSVPLEERRKYKIDDVAVARFPSDWWGGKRDEAVMKEVIAKRLKENPSCNKAMVYHESFPHPGQQSVECVGGDTNLIKTARGLDERLKVGLRAARFLRENFPEVKIMIGNSLASSAFISELIRNGYPEEYADYIGLEVVGGSSLPECQFAASLQAAECMVETVRHYGFKWGVTQCFESNYRLDKLIGPELQAAWYVRDLLIGHCWRFDDLFVAGTIAAGNHYTTTVWGDSDVCGRMPWCYPKPAYVALAAATKIMDCVKDREILETGDKTVYAVRLDRQDGKSVFALWTSRGKAQLEIEMSEDVEMFDMYARRLQPQRKAGSKGVYSFSAGGEVSYIVADASAVSSVRSVGRSYPPAEVSADWKVVAKADCADDWEIVPGELAMVEHKPGKKWPARVAGKGVVRTVVDEEKGAALEIELVEPDLSLKPMVNEYTFAKLKKPVKVDSPFSSIGVWMKGNSGWGRLYFVLRDANGRRTVSCETGMQGELDRTGRMAASYSGWDFCAMPVLQTSSVRELSHGIVSWNWTGGSPVKFPVCVEGVVFQARSRPLFLSETAREPYRQAIRIRDIGVFDLNRPIEAPNRIVYYDDGRINLRTPAVGATDVDSGEEVVFTWDGDKDPPFEVEVKEVLTGMSVFKDKVNEKRFTVQGLKPDTVYSWRVYCRPIRESTGTFKTRARKAGSAGGVN